MSRIIAVILFTCSFTYANATTLYSMHVSYDKDTHKIYKEVMGFTEDGFSGPSSVCYVGRAADVCQIVKKAAGATQSRYVQGGHGMFEVNSCKEEGIQRVRLNYTRTNDYDGSIEIQMDITPCGGDE